MWTHGQTNLVADATSLPAQIGTVEGAVEEARNLVPDFAGTTALGRLGANLGQEQFAIHIMRQTDVGRTFRPSPTEREPEAEPG